LTEVELLSAEEITQRANLKRLFEQRKAFQRENWSEIARNWNHSVFYQLDLHDAACQFEKLGIPMPEPLPESAPLMTRIHDAMFRGNGQHAFELLRQGLIEPVMKQKMLPRMSVYSDQIVWGRSPVRIDIAGGWTDTPPYCLMEGSNVVNLAIDLNGQQPLQAFIRPAEQRHIVLRSIDLGDREIVSTYEQLADFKHVGSPFSIPKAALALAGFMPQFCAERYDSLEQQLEDFGCGFEISLLSAVPKGSGLGTSSILAATVLGAISDFCDLAWDKNEICRRTLVLEQLLTTGGGWQDQFGGVLAGVKKLETEAGFTQQPVVRWLPDNVFTQPDFRPCHLLYYTGITRTAKHILAEIVRRMFLNENAQLSLLRQMKEHTQDMYEAIQRQDFQRMGTLVRKTWTQNQQIDAGTNPEAVRAITDRIDDLCLGYKLPGAGGGGYLYMVAKDPQAASRIRQILNENPQNPRARFVDMDISANGLQISRS
ncbi:MAG: bifunctional fucokinase/fucose-1-phosphate guanylyltransferase, partial [Bacteroidaceae bacterium]